MGYGNGLRPTESWRAGELESWRAGELESWRAGELTLFLSSSQRNQLFVFITVILAFPKQSVP
ncbi:hypothetical protein F0237_22465 [Vibrio tubiashii]|uniref:Uncharacterized protein n=1 Tax=Vibrio tubiashii TaxID=29498 RepID=A0AAE5LK38_9VIBR|nr:hypothetical protein [Vibrio tubiashii]